jgi:hypothetical protein
LCNFIVETCAPMKRGLKFNFCSIVSPTPDIRKLPHRFHSATRCAFASVPLLAGLVACSSSSPRRSVPASASCRSESHSSSPGPPCERTESTLFLWSFPNLCPANCQRFCVEHQLGLVSPHDLHCQGPSWLNPQSPSLSQEHGITGTIMAPHTWHGGPSRSPVTSLRYPLVNSPLICGSWLTAPAFLLGPKLLPLVSSRLLSKAGGVDILILQPDPRHNRATSSALVDRDFLALHPGPMPQLSASHHDCQQCGESIRH